MSSAKSGKQSVKVRLGTALPTFVPAPGVVLLAVDEPIVVARLLSLPICGDGSVVMHRPSVLRAAFPPY